MTTTTTTIFLGNKAPLESRQVALPAMSGKDLVAEATKRLAAGHDAVHLGPFADWAAAQSEDQLRGRVEGLLETRPMDGHFGQRFTNITLPFRLDEASAWIDAVRDQHKGHTVNGAVLGVPGSGRDLAFDEAMTTVIKTWALHSSDNPAWIACDDPALEAVLAARWGCPVGMPVGWKIDGLDRPKSGREGGASLLGPLLLMIPTALVLANLLSPQLRTSAGRDFQSKVMGDEASTGTGTYASARYEALTENATAPADGDTALAGELAAGGGGLIRAQTAFGHTGGASTYTNVKTFTMNSNDGTSRTIQKDGQLNAPSTGTLVFSTLMPNPPTLVPGDQLTPTRTVTI